MNKDQIKLLFDKILLGEGPFTIEYASPGIARNQRIYVSKWRKAIIAETNDDRYANIHVVLCGDTLTIGFDSLYTYKLKDEKGNEIDRL